MLSLAACSKDPKQEAADREKAMVEQAQKDAQAESAFTAESLAIAKTFEVKSISAAKTMNFSEEDDDGDDVSVQHYYFVSPDGKACQVSSKTFTTKAVGDTLNCQWSDEFEQ